MRRKKYSQEFKEQVIKEAMETGNCSVVARRYELSSSMVARWVREFKNGNKGSQDVDSKAEQSYKEITRENQELT